MFRITTWNSSDKALDVTLSNGNLTAIQTVIGYGSFRSILGVNNGKYYWEITVNAIGAHENIHVGIGNSDANLITNQMAQTTDGYSYFAGSGYKLNGSGSSFGEPFTMYDIISVALDMDTGKL